MTVIGLLALLAFCLTIASIVTPRVPLWIAVLLLAIIAMVQYVPFRIGG